MASRNLRREECWNDGYGNVTVGCTVENQDRADYRLSIFKGLPIKHKILSVSRSSQTGILNRTLKAQTWLS